MDLFFVITIPEGETYTWSFRNGSVSNLNTTVTFRQGDAILFESDPADTDWTDSTGGIPGGEYVVEVLAAAYSNLDTNAGEPRTPPSISPSSSAPAPAPPTSINPAAPRHQRHQHTLFRGLARRRPRRRQ